MAQKASPKKAAKKGAAAAKKAVRGTAAVARPIAKKVETPAKKSAPPAKARSAAEASLAVTEKTNKKSPADTRVAGKTAGGSTLGAVALKEPKKEKVQMLSKSDLQYFRGLLLERRREIIGDMGSMESEAFKGGSNLSNMPIHMADVGTDNFEQEFTLGLIESERQTLREIQEALVRIDNGTYGICQGTGKSIPKVRLEAVPWAKYTIEYKRLLDQGKIGQENGQSSEEDSGGDDDED